MNFLAKLRKEFARSFVLTFSFVSQTKMHVILLLLPLISLSYCGVIYRATDLPRPIPDVSQTTSTINVADSGKIVAIKVGLAIQHSYVGDLNIVLTHIQSGTSVILLYLFQIYVYSSKFQC